MLAILWPSIVVSLRSLSFSIGGVTVSKPTLAYRCTFQSVPFPFLLSLFSLVACLWCSRAGEPSGYTSYLVSELWLLSLAEAIDPKHNLPTKNHTKKKIWTYA